MSSKFNRRIMYFILILIGSMSQFSLAADKGWGKVSPEEWQMGAPPDFPEANAIVLHDICSLTVRNTGIEIVRWERMKLLSKAGADEIGDVGFPYDEDDKIKDLKAQTITPDGKTIKLTSRDYFTKTIGGVKYRTFAFPGLDSGSIVEFSYRNLNARFTHLDPWYFQTETYTLKSSFSLVVGRGFTYSVSWINVPAARQTAKTDHIGNSDEPYNTYTWTLENLLPITHEPFMRAKYDYQSAMYCQLVSYTEMGRTQNFSRNWQELGKDFHDYIDDFARGGDLDELAAKLTAGISDPAEKAKAIHEYVAREIRTKYNTGQFFVNDDLSALRKAGTGTGEEKNILLTELLNEAGIKSWPVLIGTRGYRKFNPEVCQLNQFNYLISFVQFDSSIVYLDASNKYCPYGMLPSNCLVEAGFLIDGKNSQLVKVLWTDPRTYRLDVTHMQLDSVGSVTCSTLSSLSGYFAPEYSASAEEKATNDFVKEYFLDKLGAPYTLDTADVILDSAGKCLVKAHYTLPDYARLLDSILTVRPVSFRFRTTPFTKQRRSIPVDFNYPFTYHNIVTIASDRPINSAVLPPDTTFQIDGATYRRVSQFSDGQVTIDSRLIVSTPTFSPLVYPGVKRLFEFVAQVQNEGAALVRQ